MKRWLYYSYFKWSDLSNPVIPDHFLIRYQQSRWATSTEPVPLQGSVSLCFIDDFAKTRTCSYSPYSVLVFQSDYLWPQTRQWYKLYRWGLTDLSHWGKYSYYNITFWGIYSLYFLLVSTVSLLIKPPK